MDYTPVVVEFDTPPISPGDGSRNKLRLPHFSTSGTKIMIAIVSTVMIVSMITFAVFTVQSNNAEFSKKHGLDINTPQLTGTEKSSASLPGGGVAVGIGGTTGKNAPVITLTAEPASVVKGEKSTLKWSVTNNPSSCTASDDWGGEKALAGGQEATAALTNVQNYLFTLTCKTAEGTGFKTVAVSVSAPNTTLPGSNSSAPSGVPAVNIAAKPNIMYAGDSTTIVWEATNSPSSCTAGGNWSGTKPGSGSINTGALTAVKTYTYTLVCKNASGSSQTASAQLTVKPLPPNSPAVYISSDRTEPILPGTSVKLSWRTENNPSSCTASGNWSGAKSVTGGTQTITGLTTIKEYVFTITCSNETGSITDSTAVQVIPNPPAVSLTLNPASIYSGTSSTISWSATNSPTSCTATSSNGSWTGAKSASGSASTGTMAAGGYIYSLSCTNAGGTGYANNVALTVTTMPKPVVSISANPISVTSGGSSNLTWSATNSPTSCTASGRWSGAKASSGTVSTGALTTSATPYSYTLSCTNAGGTGSATTSVTATSGTVVSPPVVSISASPTTTGTGGSSNLTWSATNSPTSCTASSSNGSWTGAKSASGAQSTSIFTTAGTYTFTLSCSNSAGSGSKSVSITVIAKPNVSVSVSPSTITAGGSTTVTWTTGNNPTSCTAGGTGWSGSKAVGGGSQAVTLTTAGTYTFTLSCANAGGTTTSNTASITVNAATYCGGRSPCYSAAQLNTHNTAANCWGYNTSISNSGDKSVYNITTFNSGYHIPQRAVNLLPGSAAVSAFCGAKDMAAYLAGANVSGVGSHAHKTLTMQNAYTSFTPYRVGYYDPAKP